jgi:hypothetical protein
MPDEQFGSLMRATLERGFTENVTTFDDLVLDTAFDFISRITEKVSGDESPCFDDVATVPAVAYTATGRMTDEQFGLLMRAVFEFSLNANVVDTEDPVVETALDFIDCIICDIHGA